jgi:hypothetical protein
MAGTLVADTLQDGAGNSTAMDNAIYGSAKAWVNFNGTSGSISSSYNVSSVSRTGTGQYTVNFTNAFVDSNYAVCFGASQNNGSGGNANLLYISSQSTSSLSMYSQQGYSHSNYDSPIACVSCFR